MNSFRSVVRDESNSLIYNCCFSLHVKWQDRIKTTHRSSRARSCVAMVVLALAVVVLPGAIGGNLAETQTLTVLYKFSGGINGGNPVGAVIRDAEGNLYGTTCCDGAYGCRNCIHVG